MEWHVLEVPPCNVSSPSAEASICARLCHFLLANTWRKRQLTCSWAHLAFCSLSKAVGSARSKAFPITAGWTLPVFCSDRSGSRHCASSYQTPSLFRALHCPGRLPLTQGLLILSSFESSCKNLCTATVHHFEKPVNSVSVLEVLSEN